MTGDKAGKYQVRIITGVYLFLCLSGLALTIAVMAAGGTPWGFTFCILSAAVIFVIFKGSQSAHKTLGLLLLLAGSIGAAFTLWGLFALGPGFSAFKAQAAWLGSERVLLASSYFFIRYLFIWYFLIAGFSSAACGLLLLFSQSLKAELARRLETKPQE